MKTDLCKSCEYLYYDWKNKKRCALSNQILDNIPIVECSGYKYRFD